jgi:hypothetical protein
MNDQQEDLDAGLLEQLLLENQPERVNGAIDVSGSANSAPPQMHNKEHSCCAGRSGRTEFKARIPTPFKALLFLAFGSKSTFGRLYRVILLAGEYIDLL